MSEKTITTPTGFLKVKITLDDSLKSEELAFVYSAIQFVPQGVEMPKTQTTPIPTGESRILVLKEGLYTVRAILGSLESEWVNTEIKTGEITARVFHFGKKQAK